MGIVHLLTKTPAGLPFWSLIQPALLPGGYPLARQRCALRSRTALSEVARPRFLANTQFHVWVTKLGQDLVKSVQIMADFSVEADLSVPPILG